jgi:predicted transcriptional regulator of viral defense system
MTKPSLSLQERAVRLLERQGMVRLSEFRAAGITAATVARMEAKGDVTRLARGVYQLPDQPAGVNHELALACKLVPNGIVCLVSALAFHELTDTIPARVWLAIGPKDRKPTITRPALQIVRFQPARERAGITTHMIEGVAVAITNLARTVVDLFRYRLPAGTRYQKSPGLNLAIEGLR